jgi:hypothetical protein
MILLAAKYFAELTTIEGDLTDNDPSGSEILCLNSPLSKETSSDNDPLGSEVLCLNSPLSKETSVITIHLAVKYCV